MRRRFAVLLIFGMVAVSGAAFADSILTGPVECDHPTCTVTEGTTSMLTSHRVTEGTVVLCDGVATTSGCAGGAVSDVVIFRVNDVTKTTTITMCSDAPEGKLKLCPNSSSNIVYLEEAGKEGKIQSTGYAPTKLGQPGFDSNLNSSHRLTAYV